MPPGTGILKDHGKNQPIQVEWNGAPISRVKFHLSYLFIYKAIYKGPIYVTPFITIVFRGPLCSCNIDGTFSHDGCLWDESGVIYLLIYLIKINHSCG